MFKAKDMMTKAVICAWPQMPISDAIRTLSGRNITGLAVVDADLNLVGVISEKDALKTLYESDDKPEGTVADYISTNVVSYDINTNMIEICDSLINSNIHRVPITDNGKLAGLVSISDVTKAILRFKRQIK